MKQELTKEEMFESIYRSYEKDVYRACLHLTMEEEMAFDMTQQAFMNCYERFDTLEVDSIKAYLIGSARNLVYNYYRKTRREVQLDDEEFRKIEPTIESVEEQYFKDIKRMMKKELTNAILMDLKERHGKWYEVIYRIFFRNMTPEEIAVELGVTKEVVYSRLHRAKLWIQKNYKENFDKVTGKI